MENLEAKIKELLLDVDSHSITSEGSSFASGIISEAYLKTIMSLGIEILSKIDTSRTRKEIGEHYVNMLREQLSNTLATKIGKKN